MSEETGFTSMAGARAEGEAPEVGDGGVAAGDLPEEEAIANEMRGGLEVIASGETLSGATRFASGIGRHGAFGAEAASD